MIEIQAQCAERMKNLPAGMDDFVRRVFSEVFKDETWKRVAGRPLIRSNDFFQVRMERLTVFFLIDGEVVVITGIKLAR